MVTMELLNQLNTEQRKAVTSTAHSLLVLAGAGSGKTRVLVHRIAWLIQTQNISPFSILAVTFTNKAAAQMHHRIESLMQIPMRGMWIGTFHGLAHRLLRAHHEAAGLEQNFQILDTEDQNRLLRRIYKTLSIDDERWPLKQAQWYINGKKDEGIRAKTIGEGQDIFSRTMFKIYNAYEEACERGGLVDFAELLLRTHELFAKNPDILRHYQDRFKHVLVDEFQDTNSIQYAWIHQLTQGAADITIVGDDDQSIYGWRGAKIENIHRFTRDFKNTETIRLEQNYRSTETILSAANALIANNRNRLGKSLWTNDNAGDPISVYAAFNEIDEARFIVEHIKKWADAGNDLKDIALLYRSNAQSRVLEETLLQNAIPYRVYGGLRFFDRAEIKDALAYLRMIANPNDDAAFERVVNTPTRGIGERTLGIVRDVARERSLSLWHAAKATIDEMQLSGRASSALGGFMQLVLDMKEHTHNLPLHETAEHVIHTSGLRDHFRKEKGERGIARIENLDELITATRQYEHDDNEQMPVLTSFLSHAALEAGEQQHAENNDYIQLMTLHSAKGLEFPLVFLCGMEEGLFPHQMSYEDPERLEEERRLCYVGMTRAMKKLYFTYAECRRLYGRENYRKASRFLREVPANFLNEVRLGSSISRPMSVKPSASLTPEKHNSGLKLGQSVTHKKFGEGVIINMEGQGSDAKIHVKFARHGSKWLIYQYANLEPA